MFSLSHSLASKLPFVSPFTGDPIQMRSVSFDCMNRGEVYNVL